MKWQPIEELNIAEGSRTMFVVKAFDVTVGWLEKYIHTSSPHCVWLGDSGKFMGWPHRQFAPTHFCLLPEKD